MGPPLNCVDLGVITLRIARLVQLKPFADRTADILTQCKLWAGRWYIERLVKSA